MNLKHLGTSYGGWTIDIDSIEDNDVIIDAGLGEDVSFDMELSKLKRVRIVGVDPTLKSHNYIEKLKLKNFLLVKKAIWKEDNKKIFFYENSNPDWVSESSYSDHSNVSKDNFHEVETISFNQLIENYKPSLIKMDIEGSEYDVLEQCLGIKQICVEFHHSQLQNKNIEESIKLIELFKQNGYQVIHSTNNYQEVTFLRI